MPPFATDPDDAAITTHCILPEPRRWLLDTCLAHGVTALAAGHIHKRYTEREHKGLRIVTAPATSFVNMPANPPSDISPMRTGYLVWHLDATVLRRSPRAAHASSQH